MDRHGVILQLYARAPAPLRDYYGLTITEKEVILNMWNISHGPHVFPKRQKCPLGDFRRNKGVMLDVANYFGQHVLEYCLELGEKDPKLQTLPAKIFLYILRHLATNDIIHLGQTSKIFFELCNRDAAWKIIFRRKSRRKLNVEDKSKVEISGWRSLVLDLDIKRNVISASKPKTATKSKHFPTKKTSNLSAVNLDSDKDFTKKVDGVYRDLRDCENRSKFKELSSGKLVFGAEMEKLAKVKGKFEKVRQKVAGEKLTTLTSLNSKNESNLKVKKSQIPNRSDYKSIYYKPELESKSLTNFNNVSSFGKNFDDAVEEASNFFDDRCNSIITTIRSQKFLQNESFEMPKKPQKFEIDKNFIATSLSRENENQKRISNFITNFRNLNVSDLQFIDEDEEVKSVDTVDCLDGVEVATNPFRIDDLVVEKQAIVNLKDKVVTENLELLSGLNLKEEEDCCDLNSAQSFKVLDGHKLSMKVEGKPKVDLQKIYANSLTKSRILNYKHGLANRHLFSESESEESRKLNVNLNEDLSQNTTKNHLKSKSHSGLSDSENSSLIKNKSKLGEDVKKPLKTVRYSDDVKVILNSGDCVQSKLRDDKKSKSFLYSLFGSKSKLDGMNNSKVANGKDLRTTMNNQLNSVQTSASSALKMIDNFGKERRNVATSASGDSKRINR